jgi:hypothetical protein
LFLYHPKAAGCFRHQGLSFSASIL